MKRLATLTFAAALAAAPGCGARDLGRDVVQDLVDEARSTAHEEIRSNTTDHVDDLRQQINQSTEKASQDFTDQLRGEDDGQNEDPDNPDDASKKSDRDNPDPN